MIRIFALLLSLMVLSVPAFAMNIEAEVENQLGIPIDGKKLPTGWKVLEKHGDSMVFQKGDFTMSYAIIPDGSVGMITLENRKISDEKTLKAMKEQKERELRKAGYRWEKEAGAYLKAGILVNIVTTTYQGEHIYRVQYSNNYE
jgi:hypothetical protein